MLAKRYRATLRRERLRLLVSPARGFGSGWHRFRKGVRCSLDEVAAFEARWGVSVPSDFKSVLTEVGAGCAGPYYGLSPLEDWSQPWDTSQFDATFLARPFDPEGPAEAGLYPGALRICNAGCDHYLLLIVSGPHAGEMWHDAGADELGVFPVLDLAGQPMSLAAWIGEWLDTLPKGELVESFWSSYDFAGHAVAKVLASAAEPLTTVAADQLPCLACVRRLRGLHPFPRVIVPAPRRSGGTLVNPKRAAILAARGDIAVQPRQVFP